jgi:hypothetical protein
MNCMDIIQYLGPYLDSELDVATTVQIQAHLTRCSSCRLRFEQEHELEERIRQSLMGQGAQDDGKGWERNLRSALPKRPASARIRTAFSIQPGSPGADWIALVASLVILAALASAGLGLRHSGQLVLPGATWMMQRYALLPDRPMGGTGLLPAGCLQLGDVGSPCSTPDA